MSIIFRFVIVFDKVPDRNCHCHRRYRLDLILRFSIMKPFRICALYGLNKFFFFSSFGRCYCRSCSSFFVGFEIQNRVWAKSCPLLTYIEIWKRCKCARKFTLQTTIWSFKKVVAVHRFFLSPFSVSASWQMQSGVNVNLESLHGHRQMGISWLRIDICING